MTLSEDLHNLWSRFMDAYASNTSGRKFTPEELQTICDRLAEASQQAAELEARLPPLPMPSESDGVKVICFDQFKKNNPQKRRG